MTDAEFRERIYSQAYKIDLTGIPEEAKEELRKAFEEDKKAGELSDSTTDLICKALTGS